MGHLADAKDILIEKEKLQRADLLKRIGNPLVWAATWLVDRLFGVTVRYGQKPLFALRWLAGLWAIDVLAFWLTWQAEAFKPNNAFVLRAPEWVLCATESPRGIYLPSQQKIARGRAAAGQPQQSCFLNQPEAEGFPEFNAGIYAFDVLVPLVQVEQQVHWIPDEDIWPVGGLAKGLVYFEIVAGWLLSLVAAAGLSGLIKSD